MRHLQLFLLAQNAAALQSRTISLSLFVVKRRGFRPSLSMLANFLFSKERICGGGSL